MKMPKMENLKDCEKVILSTNRDFVLRGKAFYQIRNNGWFKETHQSWEDYCDEVLHVGPRQVLRTMTAYEVWEDIRQRTNLSDEDLPQSESHAYVIHRSDADERAEIWERVVEVRNSQGLRITIKLILEWAANIGDYSTEKKPKKTWQEIYDDAVAWLEEYEESLPPIIKKRLERLSEDVGDIISLENAVTTLCAKAFIKEHASLKEALDSANKVGQPSKLMIKSDKDSKGKRHFRCLVGGEQVDVGSIGMDLPKSAVDELKQIIKKAYECGRQQTNLSGVDTSAFLPTRKLDLGD